MANNRMFLIYKPSKLGVMLGKRMIMGWYKAPESKELERFYDYVEANHFDTMDDFVLAMEDCSRSDCFGDWNYSGERVNGFCEFKYMKE